ncbi:tRNA pseudouridine(55) synthase TruB [Miniimonas sp. S16]|uniref:tRNA pseudouridine(55) synthase TruB n=1 Tax=Miniimonas TaxID=947525 RepID=UPI0026B13615
MLDKPAGWTSHDVVARSRRLLRTRKVGHAGTLDPMATGVLVLGVGRSTRLLTYVVGADKTYDATIRLGQATVTDDAEGEVTAAVGATVVTDAAVHDGVARLTGALQQVPSAVSAIKVDGKRSYARVRSGEEVALAARPVTVSAFDVHAIRRGVAPVADAGDGSGGSSSPGGSFGPSGPVEVLDVDVTVTCSSGTYVRALARDLGASLGCGGHLTALRRTRVGGFTLADALTLEEAAALSESDAGLAPALLPPARAAAAVMPVRPVDDAEAADLAFGRWLAPTGSLGAVAAIDGTGRLLAVLEDQSRRGEMLARPVIVLA